MTVPLSKSIANFQKEYRKYVDTATRQTLDDKEHKHQSTQLTHIRLQSNINHTIQTKYSDFQHHTHINSVLAESPFDLLAEWSSSGFSDDELSLAADTWLMKAHEWVLKYNEDAFND